jgi:hypothetical protein
MATMSDFIRPRCLISVTVLLLVGFMCAPDEARASCGDWLANHGFSHQQNGDGAKPSRDATPNRDLPCDGPFCSDRNNTPEGPAPTFRELQIERWCSVDDEPITEESRSTRGVILACVLPDGGFCSGVFRPPR